MLMNGVSVHCTYTETGLPGSESESRDKSNIKVFQQEEERREEGWKSSPPDLQGEIMYFTLLSVDKKCPIVATL